MYIGVAFRNSEQLYMYLMSMLATSLHGERVYQHSDIVA